jgi:hypothetical protein
MGQYLANPEKYASKSAPSLEFPKVPILLPDVSFGSIAEPVQLMGP